MTHRSCGELELWMSDSKVVDAQGRGLAVYHGTHATFDRFAPNPRGIFFAEDWAAAATFSSIRKPVGGHSGLVLEARLRITNPWTVIRYADDFPYCRMVDQSVPAIAARGFDGMFCPEDRVWIAFDPQQIRIVERVPEGRSERQAECRRERAA